MIAIDEALQLVLQQVTLLDTVLMPPADALGMTLAETVVADLDLPPFHKALMDGYAVRAEDVTDGRAVLKPAGTVAAGELATNELRSGEAVKIMTGAMLPPGANSVVMVEHTRLLPDGRVQIVDETFRSGQHVLWRGTEMHAGQVLLESGRRIRAHECGLMAAVGRTAVRVYRRPRVAVLATGNEVVEPDVKPRPGQIRNSNATTLCALVASAGGQPRYLGIARDDPAALARAIADGLADDILLISGGVSMGELDLVPQALEQGGVKRLFHKVAVKPGKPVWFGRRDRTLVLGLPGNPVSVLVGFELLVRPAMKKMTGLAEARPNLVRAVLAADHRLKTDRPTFWPVRVTETAGRREALPLPWHGSADLRTVTAADGFLLFPVGDHTHARGTELDLLLLS